MLENHRRAVEDLVWRHLEADARMGIKGQDTDPDRIGGVWDGERDYSTHMRHLGVNARGERTFFREALRRREAIDAALRTLSEDDRAVIRAAFEPFGRVSPGVAEVFSVSCHGSRVCLLGLAINTRAALVGYGKRHNQVSPCGADIVDWIELEGPLDRVHGRRDPSAQGQDVELACLREDEVGGAPDARRRARGIRDRSAWERGGSRGRVGVGGRFRRPGGRARARAPAHGGLMGTELHEVLTIPQVAKRAKWSRWRMWRHLVAADRELNGMLLRNVGRNPARPKYTVTLAAVKALHPQWFFDPEDIQQRVTALEEENRELRGQVVTLKRVQDVHQRALQALKPTG